MSTTSFVSYSALALASGALIPVMAALSGAFGRTIGNPNMAALVVITGAFVMVAAFTLATGAVRTPAAALAQATPPRSLPDSPWRFIYLRSPISRRVSASATQ